MFWIALKKDMKYFFKSSGNLIFVFVLPFLFILLMSAGLKDYVAADFSSFKDGKVFYYLDNPTTASKLHLQQFQALLSEGTQVEMEQVYDYEAGKRRVEQSEAFAIIKVNENQFSYYRSPFNEPEGGKIVRSLFEVAIGKEVALKEDEVSTQVIEKPRINANAYYTFTGLSFIMMYIALMIGNSVIDERRFGTVERIKMSNLGLNAMLVSKVALGITIGILQTVTVYLLSTLFLGVNWGIMTVFMILVLAGLAVVCSVFGAVIGMIASSKTIASNIVLMCVIMFAWIGGSFLPSYLMENTIILNYIIKVSPLYWAGKSLNSLHMGIFDENTYTFLGLQLGLIVVFYILYKKLSNRAELVIKGG
ncbi:ABC transporter permease [Paenibacillaceae bacterium]|nr:ABC transporter permease [Paenibacillaceae bacterium]